MIKASYDDKALVVDLLTLAFDTNKSVNYVIKQDGKREKRIRKLMDYSFELCYAFGEIYLTPDKKGVTLLMLPHTRKTTINAIWQDLTLALYAIGLTRVFKVLGRESKIKKFYPKELMYLWFIGVDPKYQGQGIGSSMLRYITDVSSRKKLPLYLETSTARNMPLYERFKFIKYNELSFSYILHMYKKEPE